MILLMVNVTKVVKHAGVSHSRSWFHSLQPRVVQMLTWTYLEYYGRLQLCLKEFHFFFSWYVQTFSPITLNNKVTGRKFKQILLISSTMKWWPPGLMVSSLDSGASGVGSSLGWAHRFVFLGKILYFHSTSLHLGWWMSTGEFIAGG